MKKSPIQRLDKVLEILLQSYNQNKTASLEFIVNEASDVLELRETWLMLQKLIKDNYVRLVDNTDN
jgi:ferritin-like metal-binding protein YciE